MVLRRPLLAAFRCCSELRQQSVWDLPLVCWQSVTFVHGPEGRHHIVQHVCVFRLLHINALLLDLLFHATWKRVERDMRSCSSMDVSLSHHISRAVTQSCRARDWSISQLHLYSVLCQTKTSHVGRQLTLPLSLGPHGCVEPQARVGKLLKRYNVPCDLFCSLWGYWRLGLVNLDFTVGVEVEFILNQTDQIRMDAVNVPQL